MAPNRPLSRPVRRPPPAPAPAHSSAPSEAPAMEEDDLGAGVTLEGNEESNEEINEGVAPESEELAPVVEDEEDAPPFPEGYTPKTMAEATLIEQWRGRQHLKGYHSRHTAEVEAGRMSVVAAEQMLVDGERAALEAQCAELEEKLAAAQREAADIQVRLADNPAWILKQEKGARWG